MPCVICLSPTVPAHETCTRCSIKLRHEAGLIDQILASAHEDARTLRRKARVRQNRIDRGEVRDRTGGLRRATAPAPAPAPAPASATAGLTMPWMSDDAGLPAIRQALARAGGIAPTDRIPLIYGLAAHRGSVYSICDCHASIATGTFHTSTPIYNSHRTDGGCYLGLSHHVRTERTPEVCAAAIRMIFGAGTIATETEEER